jgi:hypothetical protein
MIGIKHRRTVMEPEQGPEVNTTNPTGLQIELKPSRPIGNHVL